MAEHRPRLTIFSEDEIYFDGNDYIVKNPLTRLFAELNKNFDVTVSGPTRQVTHTIDGYTESDLNYSPRPYYDSVINFFRNIHYNMLPTYENIVENIKKSDLIMIRVPSPISYLVYLVAKRYGTPYFLYVAGDIREVANNGGKYQNFISNKASSVAANLFHQSIRNMAKGSLVFVIGSDLYDQMNLIAARCVNLVPSVISTDQIVPPNDYDIQDPVKLLYVGRLVPIKGLAYLLRAVPDIGSDDQEVVLDIVGDGNHRAKLERLTKRLNIENQVNFRGLVSFGDQLFSYYENANIYVLPSLSEGIPKTLLESMAFGTPIVATNVGGIPDVIQDRETGLLIDPESEKKISESVNELINSFDLRKSIIDGQHSFIKRHTVESQATIILEECLNHFSLTS